MWGPLDRVCNMCSSSQAKFQLNRWTTSMQMVIKWIKARIRSTLFRLKVKICSSMLESRVKIWEAIIRCVHCHEDTRSRRWAQIRWRRYSSIMRMDASILWCLSRSRYHTHLQVSSPASKIKSSTSKITDLAAWCSKRATTRPSTRTRPKTKVNRIRLDLNRKTRLMPIKIIRI